VIFRNLDAVSATIQRQQYVRAGISFLTGIRIGKRNWVYPNKRTQIVRLCHAHVGIYSRSSMAFHILYGGGETGTESRSLIKLHRNVVGDCPTIRRAKVRQTAAPWALTPSAWGIRFSSTRSGLRESNKPATEEYGCERCNPATASTFSKSLFLPAYVFDMNVMTSLHPSLFAYLCQCVSNRP
jgi:hypothetical protein